MFPENLVQATFQQVQTKYVKVRPKILKRNDTETMRKLTSGLLDYMQPSVEYTSGMNVLGECGRAGRTHRTLQASSSSASASASWSASWATRRASWSTSSRPWTRSSCGWWAT